MTTLLKRASPAQLQIFRAVEGAVRNTIHAHPHWVSVKSKQLAASIAKRATGTLSALSGTLALRCGVASESGHGHLVDHDHGDVMRACPWHRVRQLSLPLASGGGAQSGTTLRPSVRRIRFRVGMLAGEARKSGDLVRLAAFVEVLRIIAGTSAGVTRKEMDK